MDWRERLLLFFFEAVFPARRSLAFFFLSQARVILKEGEPWFVAMEACIACGNDISVVHKFWVSDEHKLHGRKKENNPTFSTISKL